MVLKTKITVLGISATILYAFLAFIPFSFTSHFIPPREIPILIFFLIISLGLVLIYLFAFRCIKNHLDSGRMTKLIILFCVVFSIILIFLPATGSVDIIKYINQARVFTVYRENPYLQAPMNLSHDIFCYLLEKECGNLPMQYGPLWASISIGFSYLAKDSFFWNQFLYKLFAFSLNFGSLYFVWRILTIIRPAYRTVGLLLYAWNPLILFEVVNNGHNDIMMIFLALAAVYFFLSKKFTTSLVLLLLSALVKYITILLLPVFLLFIFKEVIITKERIIFLIKIALILVTITFILFFPFWEGLRVFQGLFLQSRILVFMQLSLIPSFVFGGAYALSNIFSWSYGSLLTIAYSISMGLFLIFYLWQLVLIGKNKNLSGIIYRIFLVLTFYIYSISYLQPWYFLWFLPLAILIHRPYFTHFVFLITLIGLLSYTFFPINFLLVLVIVLVAFLAIFTKGRYFAPFISFN